MFRIGLGIIAALGLTACAERDVSMNSTYITDFGSYTDSYGEVYYEDAEGAVAGSALWSDARDLTLTVRQNEFSPMLVKLKRDIPYNLTIVNRDKNAISFEASEFFENVSVGQLSEVSVKHTTFEALEKPLLISFVVPARSERTVSFVPVMEGRYDFEDGAPGVMLPNFHFAPFSRGKMTGTFGVFIVE